MGLDTLGLDILGTTQLKCYIIIIQTNVQTNMKLNTVKQGSCVEWGSTSTGWHINVHHVKYLYKCEVKHNGDMHAGMGYLYGLMGVAL